MGSGGERAMFLSMLQQLDDDDYEDSDGVIKFHVSDATTGAPVGTAELLAGPFKLLIRDEQVGHSLVRAFSALLTCRSSVLLCTTGHHGRGAAGAGVW